MVSGKILNLLADLSRVFSVHNVPSPVELPGEVH